MTFARRIQIAMVLAVVMQLGFALLIYVNYGHAVQETRGIVARDLQTVILLTDLEGRVIDMVADVRGFSETGDEKFIEHYLSAERKCPPLFAELTPLLDVSGELEALESMRAGLERWRATFAQPRIAMAREHPPRAAGGALILPEFPPSLKLAVGQKQVDAIRGGADRIRTAENRQIAETAGRVVEASGRLSRFLGLAAAGFAAAFLAGSITLLREYRREAAVLFAGMDAAERGEFRPVPLQSGDELGHIARVFNRMLSEVERRDKQLRDTHQALLAEHREVVGSREEIRRSENLYRTLARNFPNGNVALLDRDLRCLVVEGTGLAAVGMSREMIEGKRLQEFLPPETCAQLEPPFRAALAGEESEFQLSFGGRLLLLHVLPVRSHTGEILVAMLVSLDITERRRLEERFREAQKMEALGTLAGGIAHEFNNLLTVIVGNAAMAKESETAGTGLRECLVEIERAAQRAAELARQMLAYSGRGHFLVGRVDLNGIVRQTEGFLESLVTAATLRLELDAAPLEIQADVSQIEQVLRTLIVNASEAIGEGGGTIAIRTRRLLADRAALAEAHFPPEVAEGDYAVLDLVDTGHGMDEATRAQIFDPFFSTKFSGRGLGLAAVLGIVRGHGGAIRVESEPGRGSTFTVLFPAAGPVDRAAASGRQLGADPALDLK